MGVIKFIRTMLYFKMVYDGLRYGRETKAEKYVVKD